METHLKLVLRDVFGGDGITRLLSMKDTKLTRTKTSRRTRSDIGIAVESAMSETQDETKTESISTFVLDGKGRPLLRLGGPHGKLWGTLKAIRTNMYVLGRPEFRSKQLVEMIQVLPVLVPFDVLEPIKTVQLPQKLNGPGNAMLFPYFDVIPRAKCEVHLVYPNVIASQVTEMIEQLEFVSFLNKRRATVESVEIVE